MFDAASHDLRALADASIDTSARSANFGQHRFARSAAPRRETFSREV
jgi:hypothetical protein